MCGTEAEGLCLSSNSSIFHTEDPSALANVMNMAAGLLRTLRHPPGLSTMSNHQIIDKIV